MPTRHWSNWPRLAGFGQTKVGGIDFNKPRIRWVVESVLALSSIPGGFTASELARQVQQVSGQPESTYTARQAGYDLKKLRGKQMVPRRGRTRRYEPLPEGLKALTALVVLRDKVIQPPLAAATQTRPARGARNPRPIDHHYETLRTGMLALLHELGLAA